MEVLEGVRDGVDARCGDAWETEGLGAERACADDRSGGLVLEPLEVLLVGLGLGVREAYGVDGLRGCSVRSGGGRRGGAYARSARQGAEVGDDPVRLCGLEELGLDLADLCARHGLCLGGREGDAAGADDKGADDEGRFVGAAVGGGGAAGADVEGAGCGETFVVVLCAREDGLVRVVGGGEDAGEGVGECEAAVEGGFGVFWSRGYGGGTCGGGGRRWRRVVVGCCWRGVAGGRGRGRGSRSSCAVPAGRVLWSLSIARSSGRGLLGGREESEHAHGGWDEEGVMEEEEKGRDRRARTRECL